MNWLNLARIIIIACGMIYASYEDWIKREVDDEVWILCGAAGGILTAVDLLMKWNLNLFIAAGISIALSAGLAIAFYYFGLYGGADAKAIIMISLALPIYYAPKSVHPFTGLASLSNGLLLSLGLLIALFLWNLQAIIRGKKIFEGFEHEKTIRKIAAMFLGVRVKNAREKKFWFPLEEEKNGKRFFKFGLFELEFEEAKRDDCWITPGIPLLIFITGGFIAYILVGDFLRLILDALTLV